MSVLGYRELYAPSHFGNSYESIWPNEMQMLLSEAKFWGYNVYGDWFDFADMKDPYHNPKNQFMIPQALWDRKFTNFKQAVQLGLKTSLLVTPNHVYINQLRPDLLADEHDKKHFGQLLCPSIDEARAIILANYKRLFEDFSRNEIPLDYLSGCPYDYGGCGCDSCSPWIITFGKLMVEIFEMARSYFPAIKLRVAGWWWTAEEHDLFKAWADTNYPGLFISLASHIPYGKYSPENPMVFPKGCEAHAFVHIVYTDANPPDDRYGPWGPMIAPERMHQTVVELEKKGYTGFMAYSEGVSDDINKVLLTGLASGVASGSIEIIEAYAERYFGSNGEQKRRWASWFMEWGHSFKVNLPDARREFELLKRCSSHSWRLLQWEAKLELFEANAKVLEMTKWNSERLRAAEMFFDAREKIQRGVWGLGLIRHGLNQKYHKPLWYDDWIKNCDKGSLPIVGGWFNDAGLVQQAKEA